MTVGFGLLRLSPCDFWSMTPRELARAMAFLGGSGAPARGELEMMMAAFPDGLRRTIDG